MSEEDVRRRVLALAAAAAFLGLGAGPPPSQVMTVDELLALPHPTADFRIAYGDHPLEFGDLRLPEGPGPHPVVVVVHGGCWRAQYDLSHLDAFCDALTREAGVATWSLEYRRVGHEGGGFPGTFVDVARGTDFVASLAERHGLDPRRVVAVGHSAGGHLALWLAARHRLPAETPFPREGLALRGVVALAPVPDLREGLARGVCDDMIARLLGGPPDRWPERYRLASPRELLPLGRPAILVHGTRDAIVPVDLSRRFRDAAVAAGDDVRLLERAEAGHFELVAPGTEAWRAVLDAVVSLLGP